MRKFAGVVAIRRGGTTQSERVELARETRKDVSIRHVISKTAQSETAHPLPVGKILDRVSGGSGSEVHNDVRDCVIKERLCSKNVR